MTSRILCGLILSLGCSVHAMDGGAAGKRALRDRNLAEALEQFRGAAEQGNPEAQYELGRLYASGRGVPASLSVAATWYERSAKQGHLAAQNTLASMLEEGRAVEQDLTRALHWREAAAETGNAEAAVHAGYAYLEGRGTVVDLERAAKFFRSCRKKHAKCAAYLGYMDVEVDWSGADPARGVELLQSAARQRVDVANRTLARIYRDGRHVPQDMAKAYAHAGAISLHDGSEDLKLWSECLARLTEQDLKQLPRLGKALSKRGDFLAAALALHPAAYHGDGPSQRLLAGFYADALGVLQSLPRAYAWYSLAELRGAPYKLARKQLRKALQQEVVEGIDAWAKDWHPQTWSPGQDEMLDLFLYREHGTKDGYVAPVKLDCGGHPEYPAQARTRRAEGRVMLEARISTDGRVVDARVLHSSNQGYGFEVASLEAVRRWCYKPASLNGKPTEVGIVVRTSFDLR